MGHGEGGGCGLAMGGWVAERGRDRMHDRGRDMMRDRGRDMDTRDVTWRRRRPRGRGRGRAWCGGQMGQWWRVRLLILQYQQIQININGSQTLNAMKITQPL